MSNLNNENKTTIWQADVATGRDLIGIEKDARRFAKVISSKDLTPPLTIGVFGDWGSGKTFFMRCLHDQVSQISTELKRKEQFSEELRICKIAQVEYNAWQYSKSNLWASLINEILSGISDAWPSDKTIDFELIIAGLETSIRAKSELENEIKNLEKEKNQLSLLSQKLKTETQDFQSELSRLEENNPWDRVTQKWNHDENFFRIQKRRLKRLGIQNNFREPQDLESLSDLFDSFPQQILMLWKAGILPVMLGIMLIFIVFFPGFLGNGAPSYFLSQYNIDPLFLSIVICIFLAWYVFVAGKILVIKRTKQLMASCIKTIQEEVNSERININYSKDHLSKKLDKVKEEDSQIINEIKKLETEIDARDKIMTDMSSSSLLAQYISQRSEGDKLQQQFGMVALMRQDISELSRILTKRRGELDSDSNVERVVVYVDDLDRCPPDRVAQVLEAVHLLLAFPLFVVFIAVDERWLSISLQNHFSGFLADPLQSNFQQSSAYNQSIAIRRSVTTQDYIEKIFQVPFHLPFLNSQSSKKLLKGWLLGNVEQELDFFSENHQIENSRKIDEIEISLMEELSGMFGQSPRAVIRFINIYRFIRAAVQSEVSSGEYYENISLVILLLCISTGITTHSSFISNHLASISDDIMVSKHFEKVRTTQGLGGSDAWKSHEPSIMRFISKHGDSWKPSDLRKWVSYVRQFTFLDHQ